MNDQQPTKSTPQDVFLHLLATITLYTSVFALINILFDYVNYALPDALNPGYGVGDSIRWEMALLIVMFPVFVWTFRFLRRELMTNPEKVGIKVRKWLMYLTLFLSALLIIGDLVALLYNFLQGELSPRFLLKVAIILAVAGIVFALYLYDIRRRAERYSPRVRTASWVVVVGVLVAAFSGFFIIGSPFSQRLMRFDAQRLSDLGAMQYQIVNYWQSKGKLPASLNDLTDSISGYVAPHDPETGASYEYQATGKLSFSLCATFHFSSKDAVLTAQNPISYPEAPGAPDSNWDHAAGRACFSRTIDTDLYPSLKPKLAPTQ